MCSKLLDHARGIDPGPTPGGPRNRPSHITVTHMQKASSVPCRLSSFLSRVRELPLAWVSCFCGPSHHDLDPFSTNIMTAPSFPLRDSWSLVLCLAVDLSFSFYQLPDEGSMMTKLISHKYDYRRPVQIPSPQLL